MKRKKNRRVMTKKTTKKKKRKINYFRLFLIFFVIGIIGNLGRVKTTDIQFMHPVNEASIGDVLDFSYLIYPENASDQNVDVIISDNSILELDAENNYIAKGEGEVTVSLYQDGKLFSEQAITISSIKVESVNIPSDLTIGLGRAQELDVILYPDSATHRDYTIISSDNDTIAVENNRLIAKSIGEAEITVASVDGPVSKTIVTVEPVKAEKVEIVNIYNNLQVGNIVKPSARFTPADTTDQEVTWTSSDKSVLEIQKDGQLLAKKTGTIILTVTTADGLSDSLEITVKPIPVTSISINSSKDSIYVGYTVTLSCNVNPSTATDKTITWSSNDESIATVSSNGTVKGKQQGKVTITATSSNGKTATYSLTIEPAPVVSRSSSSSSTGQVTSGEGTTYMLNTNTHKFHKMSCKEINKMAESNKWVYTGSRSDIIAMGYDPCKKCNP